MKIRIRHIVIWGTLKVKCGQTGKKVNLNGPSYFKPCKKCLKILRSEQELDYLLGKL